MNLNGLLFLITSLVSSKCTSFVSDAYIEENDSNCLRRQQYSDDDLALMNSDARHGFRELVIDAAKDECSKNRRCVGIEHVKDQHRFGTKTFILCLDATYTSTAWDKYENSTNILFRKTGSHG